MNIFYTFRIILIGIFLIAPFQTIGAEVKDGSAESTVVTTSKSDNVSKSPPESLGAREPCRHQAHPPYECCCGTICATCPGNTACSCSGTSPICEVFTVPNPFPD